MAANVKILRLILKENKNLGQHISMNTYQAQSPIFEKSIFEQ